MLKKTFFPDGNLKTDLIQEKATIGISLKFFVLNAI